MAEPLAQPHVKQYTTAELSDFVKGVLKDAGLIDLAEQLQEMKAKRTGWFDPGKVANANGADKVEKGASVSRALLALAATKGQPQAAAHFLQKKWGLSADDVVVKTLAATDETAGGALLKDAVTDDIIELLTPMSAVRSLGPTTVPLDGGTLRMPKITAGATGGWLAENTNAPKTTVTFGQIVLSAKKYAALVPISNDLIRRAGPKAEQAVRNALLRDVNMASDIAYIRANGADGQPIGLYHRAVSGNKFNANSTVNLANVTADLGTALQKMGDANVGFVRPGWIMEWRTWRYLITVRDGNGNLVFKDEMDKGTLFGLPFRRTSQIPRNLGSGDKTELYLADFADVVIGDATQVLIDASDSAAYHNGSSVVAAFSQDQTVVRAIFETDIHTQYSESIVVVESVAWGV